MDAFQVCDVCCYNSSWNITEGRHVSEVSYEPLTLEIEMFSVKIDDNPLDCGNIQPFQSWLIRVIPVSRFSYSHTFISGIVAVFNGIKLIILEDRHWQCFRKFYINAWKLKSQFSLDSCCGKIHRVNLFFIFVVSLSSGILCARQLIWGYNYSV